MGREEITRGARIFPAAPPSLELSSGIENAHSTARGAGTRGADPGPHSGPEAQLRDVNISASIDEDLARAGDVDPLPQESSIRPEKLNPAILAVSDEDRSIRPHRDSVGELKLARTAPRLAPREKEIAPGRELVHSSVAVTIANVKLALWGKGHIGGKMKWGRSALNRAIVVACGPRVGGLAACAESQEKPSLDGELSNRVVLIINAINIVAVANEDPMRPAKDPLPP